MYKTLHLSGDDSAVLILLSDEFWQCGARIKKANLTTQLPHILALSSV